VIVARSSHGSPASQVDPGRLLHFCSTEMLNLLLSKLCLQRNDMVTRTSGSFARIYSVAGVSNGQKTSSRTLNALVLLQKVVHMFIQIEITVEQGSRA
jgi:hypothetical protein